MITQEENELITCLQQMILAYLQRHPGLTLNALAQRSSVPVTSLRRLVNSAKREIAPHSVLNLCSYIYREKCLSVLIEKVEAPVADFLRSHFGNFIFSIRKNTYDVDLNEELRDQTKYLIYKLAANHGGVDLMVVVENFGSFGRKKVEEMLTAGLLLEESGRLHAREKNFSLDITIVAEHLPALVRFYKPEALAEGLNTMFSMSESLSRGAIEEIKKIQREAVMKMNAIMNDPTSQGEIPYFTINLAETLLYENNPGVQQ